MTDQLVPSSPPSFPALNTAIQLTINVPQPYLALINNQIYFTLAAAQQAAADAGLIVHLYEEDKIIDPDRPLILFRYRADAYKIKDESPILLARAYGSATSTETRFAYVWRPADTGTEKPTIEDFVVGRARRGKSGIQIRIPNPDVFSLLHTIDLTAQYRAYRAAVNFALGMERIGMDEDLLESMRSTTEENPTDNRSIAHARTPQIAKVMTKRWTQAALTIVAATGDYYKRNNSPDYYHLLGAARKLGYEAITDENIAEVAQRLVAHAQNRTAESGAVEE